MILRVGLLGLGRHGRRYAEHLAAGDVPAARLAAIWRRDRAAGRRDAARYGVELTATAAALCRLPTVDVVVIVVPPGLHPALVRAAAAAGKAVYIEKPLAATRREARRILRIVERAGVPAMVAHTLRFDPRIVALRRLRRRLGAIHALTCIQRLEDRSLAWERLPEHGAGGVLHQTGTHALDLVRVVSGLEARSVSCLLGQVRNRGVPDLASVRLELETGALAEAAVSRVSAGRTLVVEIVGDRGIARADLMSGRMTLSTGATPRRRAQLREWTVAPVPTVPVALGAFVGAVRARRSPPVPLCDAARTHALV